MSDSEDAARAGGRPRPSIAVLVAVSAIGPLSLNIFMPSMPGMQRVFATDYGTVQLTLTLYLIGVAISQLFYGPLSDRFGRRPVMLAGLSIFIVGSLLCAVAPTIEALIAARILQAVGGCAGMVLSRAIVRDMHGRDKAASVLGYITMAWVIAPMLAPSIGGLIDIWFGWRANFLVLAAVGGLALLWALRALHETHFERLRLSGATGMLAGYRRLLSEPSFLCYTLQMSFTSMVFFSFLAGAPYVMIELLGRSPLEYGLYFMLVSLGYMTGNGLSGRFAERLGVDRMILLGTGLALGAMVTMAGLALGDVLLPIAIFAPMLLVALGNGLSLPSGTAGAVSALPGMAGAAAGLSGFMQMSVGSLSSQSVGLLQDGTQFPMVFVMLTGAALALAVHLVGRRLARPTTVAAVAE